MSASLGFTASQAEAVPPAPQRVRWRLQLPGDYTFHRAGVGLDGTIYVPMANGLLHAVSPSGALRWTVQAGLAGGYGPASVGADGTVYVAGLVPSPTGQTYTGGILAYDPDGNLLWTFDATGDPGNIIAGPNVGPDGNIYAVAEYPGIGFFSLTPSGVLRFAAGAFMEYGPVGEEVVFSTDRAFFAFDMSSLDFPKLFSYDLDGGFRYSAPISGTSQPQPAVGPNGNAVVPSGNAALSAYAPSGTHLWTYYKWPGNALGRPDVGPDDVVYVARNLATLLALNPDGSEYWSHPGSEMYFDPIVRPDNGLVFTGGRITFGQPGLFMAFDTTGVPLWRIDLPDEPGFPPYGQLVPFSRPAFSADGNTAYAFADVAGDGSSPDPYGYLYAIDTSDAPAPAPPAAPSNLSAIAPNSTSILLKWTDNSSDETAFLVERCRGLNCTGFHQVATVGADLTSYLNTGLRPATVYRYRVRATNAAGNSAYSNIASARTRR